MLLTVQDQPAYCYTGGQRFDATLPTVVFIHGAQNDHTLWMLQSRYFAHHGYSVLALDLPGHGRSLGAARASVVELADWLLQLLDAAGVQQAALFGHSMGSLIALEASHQAPERVTHLGLLGAAYPMHVSDALLDTARSDEANAIDMVNLWSHSPLAQQAPSPVPGLSTLGAARQLMQHITQCNPQPVLYTDFSACNDYRNGEQAAQAVRCPTLLVCGARDQMTPPKATRLLTAAIAHAQVVTLNSGHSLMSEQPDAVLDALFSFAGT